MIQICLHLLQSTTDAEPTVVAYYMNSYIASQISATGYNAADYLVDWSFERNDGMQVRLSVVVASSADGRAHGWSTFRVRYIAA